MPADWKTKLQFEDTATFGMGFKDDDKFRMKMQEIVRISGSQILSDTTEGWNSVPTLVSEKNTLYVYTDYQKDSEGKDVAGVKVGDGLAYLIDLPFLDSVMQEHMANDNIHVTLAEKMFWNSKVRGYISEDDEENLILTTN